MSEIRIGEKTQATERIDHDHVALASPRGVDRTDCYVCVELRMDLIRRGE